MNIWRPYTQMLGTPPAVGVDRAQGAYLHLKNGRRVFDGISSWWLVTHGHSHPLIAEAIQKQSACLAQAVFADFTHDAAEKTAGLLKEFLPARFDAVFFSDNGSTAVEAAMKMAYQFARQTGEEKTKFLAFENAYHGDT